MKARNFTDRLTPIHLIFTMFQLCVSGAPNRENERRRGRQSEKNLESLSSPELAIDDLSRLSIDLNNKTAGPRALGWVERYD